MIGLHLEPAKHDYTTVDPGFSVMAEAAEHAKRKDPLREVP